MNAESEQPDLFGDAAPRHFRGRGYAAQPGTGPQGESCRTCAHKLTVYGRCGQSWVKCALVQRTSGAGSDIRAAAPACLRWQARDTDGD